MLETFRGKVLSCAGAFASAFVFCGQAQAQQITMKFATLTLNDVQLETL